MTTPRFDVFLCHNNADKPAVEAIARELRQRGIEPWLDTWEGVPGSMWVPMLEQALDDCASCAVFVGPHGIGGVQSEEIVLAIQRRMAGHRSGSAFRVIPVLLPGAVRGDRASVPALLTAATWVECGESATSADALHRLICGVRGVAPGSTVDSAPGSAPAPIPLGANPYRGLACFDVEDAGQFFGREAMVDWMLSGLRGTLDARGERRFLAIVGASGSGKSSIARAGLLAQLRGGAVAGSGSWPLVTMVPGPRPLEALAAALVGCADVRWGDGSRAALVASLIEELGRDPSALHRATLAGMTHLPGATRFVLLVDQFEELFTLGSTPEERQAFIDAVVRAGAIEGGRTTVVLTLRADLYGRCAEHSELADTVASRQFLVGPMSGAELRTAIQQPAFRAGAEFEPGLVDELLSEVEGRAGRLPLLQFALRELWERREGRDGRRLTHAAYRAIGGVDGALRRHADEVLRSLPAERQDACRRIFLRLVDVGDGEPTRRRIARRDLTGLPHAETLVDRLAAARLLTVGDPGGVPKSDPGGNPGESLGRGDTVEIVHEALVEGWGTLRAWIDADRAGAQLHQRLGELSSEWVASHVEPSRRDESLLVVGTRLAVMRDWAAAHGSDLSAGEQAFLEASDAAARREAEEADAARQREVDSARQLAAEAEARRSAEEARSAEATRRAEDARRATARARRLLAVVAVVALAAVASTGIALLLRQRAEGMRIAAQREAVLAGARLVASESASRASLMPHQRALLAVDATRRCLDVRLPVPREVRQALSDALPTLLGWPLADHDGVVFSSSGRRNLSRIAIGANVGGVWVYEIGADGPKANPIRLPTGDGTASLIAVAEQADALAMVTAGNEITLWTALSSEPVPTRLPTGTADVSALALAADGLTLAIGHADGTVVFAEAPWAADDVIALPGALPQLVVTVALRDDDDVVVAGSIDGSCGRWVFDAEGEVGAPEIAVAAFPFRFGSIAANGASMVGVNAGGRAAIFRFGSAPRWSAPVVLPGQRTPCVQVVASDDSRVIAAGGTDGIVRVWTRETGSVWATTPRELRGHFLGPINDLDLTPDGSHVASSGSDRFVRVWDLAADDPALGATPLLVHDEPCGVRVGPLGRSIWTGCVDGTARWNSLSTPFRLWDPHVQMGHVGGIMALAPVGDRRLVTIGVDRFLRVWDLGGELDGDLGGDRAAPAIRTASSLPAPQISPQRIVISRDGSTAVALGAEALALAWRLDDSAVDAAPLQVDLPGVAHDVALSEQGDLAVFAGAGEPVMVVPLTLDPARKGRSVLGVIAVPSPVSDALCELRGFRGAIGGVLLSPDRRIVLTAGEDGMVRRWDLPAAVTTPAPDGTVATAGAGPVVVDSTVLCAQGSPLQPLVADWTAGIVASGGFDGSVTVSSLDGRFPSFSLPRRSGRVRHLQLLSGGRQVITAAEQSGAAITTIANGAVVEERPLLPASTTVSSVAIDETAGLLALGATDGRVHLWTLDGDRPAEPLIDLAADVGFVSGVAIDSANRRVIAVGGTGVIATWLLDEEALLSLAERAVGRNFLPREWDRWFPGEPVRRVFGDLPLIDAEMPAAPAQRGPNAIDE